MLQYFLNITLYTSRNVEITIQQSLCKLQ